MAKGPRVAAQVRDPRVSNGGTVQQGSLPVTPSSRGDMTRYVGAVNPLAARAVSSVPRGPRAGTTYTGTHNPLARRR